LCAAVHESEKQAKEVGPVSPVARLADGGWIAVISAQPEHQLSLRVKERHDHRLKIVGLVFFDGAGLSGAMLRELPLGAWEAQINTPEVAALLRERLTEEGPSDFYDLAAEHKALDCSPMPEDADDGALEFHLPSEGIDSAVAIIVEPQLDLGVTALPAGRRPDAFYRAVADAYSWLAGRVRRPAVELAAANHVPTTTIHRWVKEARRRGLLGPGRRVVVYDPASPEVREWAERVHTGRVSQWDLDHDPLLRAWASRIRRGMVSWSGIVFDPLYTAAWARLKGPSLSDEEKLSDPVVRLLLESPDPERTVLAGEEPSEGAPAESGGDTT
jgi:hypothetical protein